jgi:cbb3-type cytochrome oxidase cytochrome c subunit
MNARRAFALFGFLLIVSFIVAVWREVEGDRPWKRYQREFNKIELGMVQARLDEVKAEAERLTDDDAKKAMSDEINDLGRRMRSIRSRPLEIKQVLVGGDVARPDRCITCHLGADRIGFEDAPKPFTTHSELLERHPVETFGCAVCHRGQGVATTVDAAHGHVKFFLEPIHKPDYLQASCVSCHTRDDVGDMPQALVISEGWKLVNKYGCFGCHVISGLEAKDKIGPDLTHLGSKTTREWVVAWLDNPKSFRPETRMPRFESLHASNLWEKVIPAGGGDALEYVADYLMSLTDSDLDNTPDFRVASDLVARGKTLVDEHACMTCHKINGEGGGMVRAYAPDLSNIGAKANKRWLFRWIKNPRELQPRSRMPHFRFTDADARAIAAYLTTLTGDAEGATEVVSRPVSVDAERAEIAKTIIRDAGCLGCHNVAGIPEAGRVVAPELADIGEKREDTLDWGVREDERRKDRSIDRWLSLKLREPRGFRDTLRMPNYGLSDDEIKALTTVLLSFKGEEVPERFKVRGKDFVEFVPTGEAGELMADLRCTTCHTMRGKGEEGAAPDIRYEGSRVKREWLAAFLRNPTDQVIRPLMPLYGLRMPKFNLSEREVNVLTDYMQTAMLDPRVERGIVDESRMGPMASLPASVSREKWNECLGCHQLRGEGNGEIGPKLDPAPVRLKGDWTYTFIVDPKMIDPSTIMRDMDLTDREARDIVNYLMVPRR